jgi:hypothetical protein
MGSTACVFTDERWSRNDCRVERSWECDTPNGYILFTGISDSNASGSRITGPFTATIEGICTSTYDLEATRQ